MFFILKKHKQKKRNKKKDKNCPCGLNPWYSYVRTAVVPPGMQGGTQTSNQVIKLGSRSRAEFHAKLRFKMFRICFII